MPIPPKSIPGQNGLFCAHRARAWAKSVLARPAQGHSSQIWVCHRGYLSLTQNFKPMRAWAKSVLANPAQGHSSQIWVCHRGYLSMTQFQTHVFLRFSMPIPPKSIPGQNGNFFARRAARAPGQNQFWPTQPRAISGYVTGGTSV